MSVKKASEHVGIGEQTISYYNKAGLFLFVERDNNGYRNFTVDDLYWIEFIKCMRKTHMPISKLKEITDLYYQDESTKMKRRDIFLEHERILLEQKNNR